MKNLNNNTYFEKKLSYIIFFLLNLLVILFTIVSLSINDGYALLSLSGILFVIIITLPIVLTKLNWPHPLMIQMLLFLMQAGSIILRGTGYIPLEFHRFNASISAGQLEQLYIKTMLLNSIGLLITYFFAFIPKFKVKPINFNIKRKNNVLFLLILAWGAFYILMNRMGGVNFVLQNYQRRLTTFSSETSLYLVYLTQLGTVAGLYYYIIEKKKSAFSILVLQLLISVILGNRGQIIFNIIIPILIIHHYLYKKIQIKKLFPALTLTAIFYQILGNYRSHGYFLQPMETLSASVIKIFERVEHFGITANVIYLVDYDRVNYLFFTPLINIIFAPFPRSLFPWKPTFIAESALVGSLIYNIDSFYIGLPPGLYGYGYLNFGWMGVIIFAIISGIAINIFYKKLIGYKLNKKATIPNGNLLIYVSYVVLITNPISTEVQIKAIMAAVPLLYIYLNQKTKV